MTYTTKQGDMWDTIAHNQLGSVSYTDKLMNINRKYREVFIFPAGITLDLPDIQTVVSSKLPPWKKVNG